MSYIALYRAYRPQNFDDLTGQEAVVKTLRNAVINNKIGHAYIFSGPRGTGKTSMAKIFAKAINCESPINGNPCNKCQSCLSINSNASNDIIEIDGASNNGVDEIRDLRDKVKYLPSFGKYKVYIIDEVHMLTTGAFNALLKTLEEPPKHVIFILATTEPYKIPATILSRCQRFDYKNISENAIIKRIETVVGNEGIKIDNEAITLIARNANGGLRDALSLLDQAVSYCDDYIKAEDLTQILGTVSKKELIKLIKEISNNNVGEALNLVRSFFDKGKDENRIINDLIYTLKDFLLSNIGYLEEQEFNEISNVSINKIYYYLDVLFKMQNNMKFTTQKKIYLEIAIIQMIEHEDIHKLDMQSSIIEIRKELEDIKKQGIKVNKANKKISLVTIENIENILNEAIKGKKEEFESIILHIIDNSNDEQLVELLKAVKVVAASSDEFILTTDNIIVASQLMSKNIKKQVLALFNDVKDYFVILDNDWIVVRNKYVELMKMGDKKPKIGQYDFKIYEKLEKNNSIKVESESVRLAKEYFGEEKVIIKE